MATGNFIAYYRVSTDRQGKSGLGLEAQEKAVTDYLNGGDWQLIESFAEVESGKRKDRPQLQAALAACKKQKATLVIARMDRLARNLAFIANLMESGVTFIAADMPEADRSFLQIAAVFAEWEGRKISERTKAALAAAKRRGTVLGNPTNLNEARRQSQAVRSKQADQHAANILPIINQIKGTGATSLRQIATSLNLRGVKTPRGGEWEAKAVKRVIDRAA